MFEFEHQELNETRDGFLSTIVMGDTIYTFLFGNSGNVHGMVSQNHEFTRSLSEKAFIKRLVK